MTPRIDAELALLRMVYPGFEYREDGHWVRIPTFRLPDGVWMQAQVEVCFQIPSGIPGEAPYGFYVRPNLALASGSAPNNYTYPAPTPFGSDWGKFSWVLEPWAPQAEITAGSNMLNFIRSFYGRLKEGA